ncbi:MAG: DNA-binding NtrC family response regulator [Zhongshania marina]
MDLILLDIMMPELDGIDTCKAINEQLVEAEFFGSVKGAFTGANAYRKDFFELADGGTLFLDEMGDLPLSLQAKLLLTLEGSSFYPVGGQSQRRVKVRVVSATNVDLDQKIAQRAFRENLYFRLAQYSLRVPPLRHRRVNIEVLARHSALSFAEQLKVPVPSISREAIARLRAYHFPGNIHELKNIMERAIIGSRDAVINAEHIQTSTAISQSQTAAVGDLAGMSLKEVKTTVRSGAAAMLVLPPSCWASTEAGFIGSSKNYTPAKSTFCFTNQKGYT